MQVKFLKDLVEDIAGPNAVKIVDILYGKKNVNEFLIAKKMELTINQTRNILYKLGDEGLVSFIRKKDVKKGGWYTYFWTLNVAKGLFKFKEKLENEIEGLRRRLKSRRTKRFFYCENCGIEYGEEQALLHDYACPECGEILVLKESIEEIENIKKEVAGKEEILGDVNGEIEVVLSKEEKARERRFKAEKKKKEEERLKRKKARERVKKREARKKGKKIRKKKKKVKRKKKKPKKKFKKKKKAKKKVKKKPRRVKKKPKKKKIRKKSKKAKKKKVRRKVKKKKLKKIKKKAITFRKSSRSQKKKKKKRKKRI